MKFIFSFLSKANSFVQNMSVKEWAVVGIAIVVVGVFTMRGFGSRKNY